MKKVLLIPVVSLLTACSSTPSTGKKSESYTDRIFRMGMNMACDMKYSDEAMCDCQTDVLVEASTANLRYQFVNNPDAHQFEIFSLMMENTDKLEACKQKTTTVDDIPATPITAEEIRTYIDKMEQRVIPDVDIEKPFPWKQRTSLVIYSDVAPGDNPDKKNPSLVFHNYQYERMAIISDGAPYLIEASSDNMGEIISQWIDNARDQSDLNRAMIARQWVSEKSSEYYFIELEPAEVAGNAYPWARHADQQ
ncbi:hypothetical protein [Spongorhabdus nitratireducens]